MSYQVLARKWRPRSFREMVGQTHVLKALINALDSQRLHHAYLFTGTRGVGKTTIARIIAKCLNCETGITSTPCGTCSVCREIDEGRFVDLIEIDAASRTKVEDTRELLDNVQYAPSRGRFKVYLIDEVHMLSSHSFNALLKTLEEPPPYVKFILATTDPQKLPATILSRCLQFSLKNMTPERVVEHLTHVLGVENVPFEDDALWLLGRAADGSMRDAMSLTDQAIAFGEGKVMAADVRAMLGTLDHGQVYDVLHALINGDAKALLEAVRHLAEQGPDWNGVLSEILNVLHRVAIAQALPDGVDNGHGDRDRVLALAQALPAEDVQFYYQMGLIGRRDLPLAPDPRGGFEMVLLRMLAFRPADSADAPRQPLKPVGISQATVDSAQSVAGAAVAAPVSVAAAPVAAPVVEAAPAVAPVVAPAPVPAAPVAPAPQPVVETPAQAAPVAAEEVVDLPWDDPVEPVVAQQPAVEPVLETAAEQPELTPMPTPTPDSVVPDAPEWVSAPVPEPSVAEVDAATPGIDLDDEPPLDEDYIEPDMDSAYSYLDELASEHTADPEPEPEPLPAAQPATGLALEWLELFPKLPISGMTASIAANCTLIAAEGDNWLLHLDPAHSALFNATQQRRLNDALNQYHQRTLTVSIELIKPEQETPAQAASRRRANRQREAEESIHGDPFIQQMVREFGAVVRHDTIEPVEALVSQG
ncbi:DNA polymerase III, gamma subunit /DNA polymerase III, tau subunit [Pseudomonas chlororaphis]|uniref:DNA polymerase III subunit gamma/tau n=1 Tax=Pseudomonas chlororaphis TaxID=587753 RepID=UPI00087C0056|nr:DNA polymerase III subunit gamma/tau [Pseudomonas chlororaphis]AZD65826.1 DNA polymerase III, gamma-tau subunit [Pseudomonas chlororaphis subsp. aurantiaca]QIT21943.1 DNA polymerase III subunit gamma/tau [Pseudomonas chlororaphis subsp. aurantiaca]WDH06095.1 DNA polymerase III subunit gamma/tau [Pseudomonas chlororaphis]WDH11150.1 DNA polymerase III subunit gamma/tau [Pseudomonas chlororaphis]SDT45446.1 DNA polymerase III, gamma subunit /DNA polymerase III, tau subunit [Pseudomonas chlorora